MRDKLTTALLLVLLLVILLTPFVLRPASDDATVPGGDAAAEKLVIISPHWEGTRYEFGRAFSRWMRSQHGRYVRVEWIDVGGTSDAVRFIKSEFERNPNGIGVDVLFGGGIDPQLHLAERNLLWAYRLPAELLARIPRAFSGIPLYDEQFRWYGAAISGFGIICNKPVLGRLGIDQPRTWEDLTRPELFSWVGSSDPRYSGTMHMMYEIILQAYGFDRGFRIMIGLGANVRGFSRSSAHVPRDTTLGEVACGLAMDSYAWAQIAQVGPERISYVLPDNLTIINPDGISILRGSPRRELAQRFLQFVLSEPGQLLWMLPVGAKGGPVKFDLGRMSILPELYGTLKGRTPIKANPFAWRSQFEYDPQKGSARWSLLNALIGAAIIDTHEELNAAWRRALESGRDPRTLAALVTPPITEDQLMAHASAKTDAVQLSRLRTRWENLFRKRYVSFLE